MDFFYAEALNETDQTILLCADESRHLQKVFRKRPGERIFLSNGNGGIAEATFLERQRNQIICRVDSFRHIPPSLPRLITVAVGVIRPNRLDWAVEKLTELGVGHIQPLHTRYTDARSFKAGHIRNVAVSAMKQSRQAYLPQVSSPLPFSDWLHRGFADDSVRLLAHLNPEARPVHEIEIGSLRPICIAIGPEGGFSAEEIEMARESGFRLISLTDTVLRSETACVAAVSQLWMRFNDSGNQK